MSTKLPRFLFSLFVFIPIVFITATVVAQTLYVKPSSEIVVRRGAGTDFKIIAMLKDGAAIELLEENDTHSKIRLANNKEGWVLKRFLSKKLPLTQLVESLKAENEVLTQNKLEGNNRVDTIDASLKQTATELQQSRKKNAQLNEKYMQLQADTANAVAVKKTLQKTLEENKVLVQKMTIIQRKNDDLRNDSTVKWFLAGAGVLMFGFILGGFFCRSYKRKPSLL